MKRKRKRVNNKGFIVDIKIQELDFRPILKGRFTVPTLDDLFELLKRKIG